MTGTLAAAARSSTSLLAKVRITMPSTKRDSVRAVSAMLSDLRICSSCSERYRGMPPN